MKKVFSTLSIILIVAVMALCLFACDNKNDDNGGNTTPQHNHVDYVDQLKLDLNSTTAKVVNPEIKSYIDGDTTHFTVSNSVIEGGVLKARYIAIDTPESTGKIEPYGKKASRFTKEKLSTAASVVIEADGDTWEADSTGSRYMTWVWYKPTADSDYRNLNVEILQNGLAIASNTGKNRYGTTAMAALNQAKVEKLNVHSGEPDPDFYSGNIIELTLKELRCNPTEYVDKKIAFEGIVVRNNGNNSVYVESMDVDPDTGLHYGMPCYYGFNMSSAGLEVLSIGNHVRIVGTFAYYETGGTYQVSGMTCNQFNPDNPDNIKVLEGQKYSAPYSPIDAEMFANQTQVEVELENNDEITKKKVAYPELLMGTSVSLEGLKVVSIYTTTNPTSSQKGAMTFTCTTANGLEITVRTAVLKKDGEIVTATTYRNKTINIKGIVDYYSSDSDYSQGANPYQIKVFTVDDIVIVG